MSDSIDKLLESALTAPFHVGQILVQKKTERFVLSHRDDKAVDRLKLFRRAEDAIEIAKHDDAGKYRPLKTAPNMRHGWRMELEALEDLRRALDHFYPGRLAVFATWKSDKLQTTPLRATLDRQSGMYRVAAKISDSQINDLVADFCRSDGGCLRTILWKRDADGAVASTKLPKEKFDPARDQTAPTTPHVDTSRCDVRTAQRVVPTIHKTSATVPLLCQEACNLLIAECRKVVKGE